MDKMSEREPHRCAEVGGGGLQVAIKDAESLATEGAMKMQRMQRKWRG